MKAALTVVMVLLGVGDVTAQVQRADTLPLQHHVVANQLPLNAGSLIGLRLDQSFTYVGGQRFVLFGVADAEQHLFVVADSAKIVRRLCWVQVEGYLPDRSGTYDYSADTVVKIQDLPFRANVSATATSGPVRPGSDREWMLGLLSGHGYRLPRGGTTRLRLIHLPDATRRREVMIIYLEPTAALGRAAATTLLSRAAAGIRLIK